MSVSACQPPGLREAAAPPDAGGAVEVEEAPGAVAGRVLDDEVAVEEDRLDLRQQREIAVQVLPARLHHPDRRIREVGEARAQHVGTRDEVGVEDEQELPAAPSRAPPGARRP